MTANDSIRARVDAFAAELEELIGRAALEAVSQALGVGSSSSAPPRAATFRASAQSAPARVRATRKKGQKRSPDELARVDAAILAFVKENPGQGAEQMGKSIGIPTVDLRLRVGKLLEQGALKKKGQKRATKYFPG